MGTHLIGVIERKFSSLRWKFVGFCSHSNRGLIEEKGIDRKRLSNGDNFTLSRSNLMTEIEVEVLFPSLPFKKASKQRKISSPPFPLKCPNKIMVFLILPLLPLTPHPPPLPQKKTQPTLPRWIPKHRLREIKELLDGFLWIKVNITDAPR